MDKVQGSASNASGFKRGIKITALINKLERVNAICQKESVLSALAQFWSSDLRCFKLPHLDLVPTIEEYEVMLGIPVKKNAEVYSYKGSHVSQKKIADKIGLPTNQTGFEIRGSMKGWKKKLLEDHLENLAREGKWNLFKPTLALLKYGLVLFPFTLGIVDQAVMDVFFFYETQGMNPVMAILANTLMSMEICHKKDKAWENIIRKGEKELGRARVAVSPKYIEWRKGRRAQMKLIEEREERAMTKIEILQSQCQKNGEVIERQRDESANANTRLAKRRRSGKEKEVESLSSEMKKMQEKIGIMKEERVKIQTEKEDLEMKSQEKDQMIGQVKENLSAEVMKMQEKIEIMEEEMTKILSEKEDLKMKSQEKEQMIELMKENLSAEVKKMQGKI
ncbi:hypothetical protein SESBI_16919 [Sesbania bispinosa]|nr:hypothetical protein SESBI_16919 [Sesbania bispinosa]